MIYLLNILKNKIQQLSLIFQVGIEIAIIAGKNTIYTTINKLHKYFMQ